MGSLAPLVIREGAPVARRWPRRWPSHAGRAANAGPTTPAAACDARVAASPGPAGPAATAVRAHATATSRRLVRPAVHIVWRWLADCGIGGSPRRGFGPSCHRTPTTGRREPRRGPPAVVPVVWTGLASSRRSVAANTVVGPGSGPQARPGRPSHQAAPNTTSPAARLEPARSSGPPGAGGRGTIPTAPGTSRRAAAAGGLSR